MRAREPRGEAVDLEIATDADRIGAYLQDAAHVPGGHADAVALPRNERQVADAVRQAPRLLVVGAQSSLTGGATPRGGTVLSTARLRDIHELDGARLRAGAGVTMTDLADRLRARGASYPPAPTWSGATVGGTIATNAAGAATFKYGATRAWIEALTVVLASGDVLDLERGRTVAHPDGYFELELASGRVRVPVPSYRMPQVPKVSAGYFSAPAMDPIDLFIGSEGTLGIVTEATLRIVEKNPATCLAFVTARERETALAFVAALRTESEESWRRQSGDRLDVCAIEHMDRRSLALLREDGVDRQLGVTFDPQAEMALLVTIELPRGDPAPALERFAVLLEQHGIDDDPLIALPGDDVSARRLIAVREAVPLAVNRRIARAQHDVDPRIEKTAADVIVPFDRFGAMLERFDAEARRRRLDLAVWGHISDGNVHPNIIPRSVAELESGREALLVFGREAIGLGGSPLAEHGVGRSRIKQQLLAELYGAGGIEQMKAVKRALDPDWKLAPGVLFEEPIDRRASATRESSG